LILSTTQAASSWASREQIRIRFLTMTFFDRSQTFLVFMRHRIEHGVPDVKDCLCGAIIVLEPEMS
jgi:hypothetical protein